MKSNHRSRQGSLHCDNPISMISMIRQALTSEYPIGPSSGPCTPFKDENNRIVLSSSFIYSRGGLEGIGRASGAVLTKHPIFPGKRISGDTL